MDVSYGSVQMILKYKLGYSGVCAKWVPRLLTKEMKNESMRVCKICWDKLTEDENRFNNVVTNGQVVHVLLLFSHKPVVNYG